MLDKYGYKKAVFYKDGFLAQRMELSNIITFWM